jgi:UDP-GlcNAc3NAcA epimerase
MTQKILTVIGARPQFIKAALVSKAFKENGNFEELLVHTGQHYDANMSKAFEYLGYKQGNLPIAESIS